MDFIYNVRIKGISVGLTFSMKAAKEWAGVSGTISKVPYTQPTMPRGE